MNNITWVIIAIAVIVTIINLRVALPLLSRTKWKLLNKEKPKDYHLYLLSRKGVTIPVIFKWDGDRFIASNSSMIYSEPFDAYRELPLGAGKIDFEKNTTRQT